MTAYLLPGDLNAIKFGATCDLLSSTCAALAAAIPGSMWRVETTGAGYVSGRVGCVEVHMHLADDGSWSATAGPTTYRPFDLGEFECNASGDEVLELAHEILGDAWLAVAMASRFEA
jgi:hypothetical protein